MAKKQILGNFLPKLCFFSRNYWTRHSRWPIDCHVL